MQTIAGHIPLNWPQPFQAGILCGDSDYLFDGADFICQVCIAPSFRNKWQRLLLVLVQEESLAGLVRVGRPPAHRHIVLGLGSAVHKIHKIGGSVD